MDLEYESSSSLRNMTRITSKIQKQAFAHWAIVVKALYFRFECWTDSPKATKSSRANEVNLASSTLTQMGLACPASQIPHTFFSSPTDATSIQSTIQSTSQLDSQPVAFSSSSSEPTVISEDEEKKPTYNKTLRRA